MITAYYRPNSLEEAASLLSRPDTFPLGGGTFLNQKKDTNFAVVDLQALDLNKIHNTGDNLKIGATATLQSLFNFPMTPDAMRTSIKLETTLNLRNMSTVAGMLMVGNGRSPFLSVMLALDAKLSIYSDSKQIKLGDFLPLRTEYPRGKLITEITTPLNIKLAYDYVARTPEDKPIVCVVLAKWPSGRTRLIVGGWSHSPSVALDGTIHPAEYLPVLTQAAQNATHDATDEWASKDYRSAIAGLLAIRCAEIIFEAHAE
jgi:CO/xanthine dehydrogenase FAD-binding subunit